MCIERSRTLSPARSTTWLLGPMFCLLLLAGCANPLGDDSAATGVEGTPEATATRAPALTIVTPTPVVFGAPTSADPSATGQPEANPGVYIVAEGDSLYAIALRFGVELDAIIAANGLSDPNDIQVGQELVIPPKQ